MITEFAQYKNKNEPKIGDYAICIDTSKLKGEVNVTEKNLYLVLNYFKSTAGKIIGINYDEDHPYEVQYILDISSKDEGMKKIFNDEWKKTNVKMEYNFNEIIFDENLDSLEIKVNAIKYNL